MTVLTAEDRKRMPASEFAGPNRSFPIGDKTHAREAISGATRSEHAGNISKSEEDRIKGEARAKLGDKGGNDDPAGYGSADHKAAIAKMHPEHVHRLVQDAHAGKYGPEAQKAAQSAMQQAPAQQDTDQDGQSATPNYASMFNANEPDGDEDQTAPVPAGNIFSRGR
jgi:hypothetical protein